MSSKGVKFGSARRGGDRGGRGVVSIVPRHVLGGPDKRPSDKIKSPASAWAGRAAAT